MQYGPRASPFWESATACRRWRRSSEARSRPEECANSATPRFARSLRAICGCAGDWTMPGHVDEAVAKIRAEVGREEVILGLSGGVDSSVAAALIHRAIGDQLTCIFVDTGLLRQNEATQVM